MFEDIKIVFEDEDLLVVDKPAGVLVHPTMAQEKDTLVDFLLKKYPGIETLAWPEKERLGIVHRLDKETSGLIILAKNPQILEQLQDEFKNRSVQKTYVALVFGKVENNGTISADIVRHPSKDLMTISNNTYSFSKGTAREAVTDYKALQYFIYKKQPLTLVEVYPRTGRMHQIRVHFKFLGFPLLGDPLYFIKPSRRLSKELKISRQFLHAAKLEFTHPKSGQKLEFSSPLAADLQKILDMIS